MVESFVLVLLLAGKWEITPLHYPTEAVCEERYKIGAEIMTSLGTEAPEYRCVKEYKIMKGDY